MLEKVNEQQLEKIFYPPLDEDMSSVCTPVRSNRSFSPQINPTMIEPMVSLRPLAMASTMPIGHLTSTLSHGARVGVVALASTLGGILGLVLGAPTIAKNILNKRKEPSADRPGIVDFLVACYQCGVLSGLCAGLYVAQRLMTEEEYLNFI